VKPVELHAVLSLMRNPYGRDPKQVREAILKAADELERLHPNLTAQCWEQSRIEHARRERRIHSTLQC
jgi:hypothetical protein